MALRIARRTKTSTAARCGIAAVEAALIMPVMVLLMLGVWEVGRMLDAAQVVANACREGARQAAAGQKTSAQIQQDVLTYLAQANVPTSGATVTVSDLTSGGSDPTQAAQLDQLQVTVVVPTANIRWLGSGWFDTNSTLTATTTWNSMRDVPVAVTGTVPPE
jgi:Flp pilus assembly protein TadG